MTTKFNLITVFATLGAVLVTTPSFAKVPHYGAVFSAERTAAPARAAEGSSATGSLQRYRKAPLVREPLQACTHQHRYSEQHRM